MAEKDWLLGDTPNPLGERVGPEELDESEFSDLMAFLSALTP